MQVFGLPGHVIRNAARASRLLSQTDAGTRMRAGLVRRWRRARRDGLTVEQAARAVGVPVSTLRRWEKRPELLPTRPRRCRRPELRRRLESRVRELRMRFPAWGRGKIAAVLRREGTAVSDATVGRVIHDLVSRGRMAPVSAFTPQRRRSRNRRPHAVRIPISVNLFSVPLSSFRSGSIFPFADGVFAAAPRGHGISRASPPGARAGECRARSFGGPG